MWRMRSLAATLVVALLLVLIVPHATARAGDEEAAACGICVDAHAIACAQCEGDGREVQPCDACDGTGEPGCDSRLDLASLLGRMRGRGSGKPAKHDGKQPCPNVVCRDGTVTWDDGKTYKCKLCAGRGRVACGSCEGGKRKACGVCRGKRVAADTCRSCDGLGKLSCTACVPADASLPCRECRSSFLHTCRRCGLAAARSGPCTVCDTSGLVACGRCGGAKRFACTACGCTGRYRAKYAEDGTMAQSSGCDACGKRGYIACKRCDGGREKCRACDGRGETPRPCPACDGRSQEECRLCTARSWAALENTGLAQEASGDAAAAEKSLRRALTRLREREDAVREDLMGTLTGMPKPRAEEPPLDAQDPDALRQRLDEALAEARERFEQAKAVSRLVAGLHAASARIEASIERVAAASAE